MIHGFVVSGDNFDVVKVTGVDAERFLQGQLTCDISTLPIDHLDYGACCNNKGRVIALFTLIRRQDAYYLCMTKGLGEILTTTLRKFIPFYKCSMELCNEQMLYAATSECASKLLAHLHARNLEKGKVHSFGKEWISRLSGATEQAFSFIDTSAGNTTQLIASMPTATLQTWEALRLATGHFPFNPADSEKFTPQELGLDQNGYVSFTKGCYTGQEIVARLHYRGKLKTKLFLFQLENTPSHALAYKVTNATEAEIGHCLLIRHWDQQVLALTELPAETPTDFQSYKVGTSKVIQWSSFPQNVSWLTVQP